MWHNLTINKITKLTSIIKKCRTHAKFQYRLNEGFACTNGVFRSRKSKKDRQYNGRKIGQKDKKRVKKLYTEQ